MANFGYNNTRIKNTARVGTNPTLKFWIEIHRNQRRKPWLIWKKK